jgi:hypothetical protein
MKEKKSVFGVLLIMSLFLLIPSESKAIPLDAKQNFSMTTVVALNKSGGVVNNAQIEVYNECKALAEAVKTQANDYYIVVNGKEYKAGRASVVLASTFDAKKVMKDEYSINFNVNKEKNIENEYLSVLCSENTNSILFNYNGTKLGGWSEVATTERSFFTYTKSKNLKKISTAGTFVQSDKNGGMGGYTYTTPWKSDFNNLNKRLVLVTESDNVDSKTSVSEHVYSDQADYNQCVKDENPYCIKKSGNFLIMFVNSGVGSKKIDFWIDSSVSSLEENSSTNSKNDLINDADSEDDSDTILDVLAEDGYLNAGFLGGATYQNEYAYGQCIKLVDALKNKSFDYEITVNGDEFKANSYLVQQTKQTKLGGDESDDYSIILNLGKTLKDKKDYLSLGCSEDNSSVNFVYIGDKLGVKDEKDVNYDKQLTIVAIKNKLKKIATKGTYKQIKGSEWGGYTYTTPWKSSFNNFDKKLVLVSEESSSETKTSVTQYKVGGFTNYTKCLKSDKPFCFKKVGNKLVMFAHIGNGSKIVNFWTK